MSEEASHSPEAGHEEKSQSFHGKAFEVFDTTTSFLRALIVNLVFLIAFITVVPLVVVEMFRDRVTIEPIAVPEKMSDQGYNGDVVANRLWDAVQQVGDEARTQKERLSVLPSSRRVEFAFPDSGISFESLIYHVRRFFNLYETRIGGEFICATEPCTHENLRLRIRLIRESMDIIELPEIGKLSDDAYFKKAAAEILRYLDPFVAASYLYSTDPEHALADLRRIVRAHHQDAKWALNLIGNIMGDRKDFAEAIASYEAALKLDPTYRIALVNQARVTSEMGKHDEAMSLIDRALTLDAGYANAWIVRGQIEAARGHLTRAVDNYSKAAELDPNSPWPQWRIGYSLAQQGDFAAAKAAFNHALEVDPDFISARDGIALVAMNQSDNREVLLQYREIARLKPGNADAIADVASAYALNKDLDNAIAQYREALKLAPGTAAYLNHLGQLLRDKGSLDEAVAALQETVKHDPKLAEAWFNLGTTYQHMGRKPEAKQALETFMRLDPDSPFVALAKAFIAQMQNG